MKTDCKCANACATFSPNSAPKQKKKRKARKGRRGKRREAYVCSKKKTKIYPSVVIPALKRQKQKDLYEYRASLFCIGSSKSARAT